MRVMGVVNVTPDSFSDGGEFLDHRRAIDHGLELIADGAAIVDIGGESTRPGADPVPAQQELDRVLPVIIDLAAQAPGTLISIDTRKAEVARAAVAAGAHIINDVSASLAGVAAETGADWIAMHMRGEPRTMQDHPTYADVVVEVREFLRQKAADAALLGVGRTWVDPGIGFGKTTEQNLELLRHLEAFRGIGVGLALGVSRKGFLGRLLGRADPRERLAGSLAVTLAARTTGVDIIRVHDVRETVDALRIAELLQP